MEYLFSYSYKSYISLWLKYKMLSFQYFVIIFLLCLSQESFSEITGTKAKDLRFRLPSGDLMPLVGMGTYLQTGEVNIKNVLDYALGAGYRLIDSGAKYGNEREIGKALKELLPKHNLTRKDIFITSKLKPNVKGENAYEGLKTSFKNLDSEYIDLYLIHWPGVLGVINSTSPENIRERDERWQALVKGVKEGLTKNIGVSNYNVRQLKELLANDHGIKPAVNQVEWHPFNHQQELLDLCNKEGILLQAYYSLGGKAYNKIFLEHTEVKKIGEKLERTPAQILLRWSLQQNISIIPKASSQERIEKNIDLDFTIPEEDMKALNGSIQKRYAWDPNTVA